jgi:hypothetical protein
LIYVALAAAGLAKGWNLAYLALPLAFMILRSLFLGTLENPEPRYTLECYPVVILLASIVFRGSVLDTPMSSDKTMSSNPPMSS